MAEYLTRQFGVVEYGEDAVVEFAEGLPAFDSHKRFVLIERPETAPVVFLQSLVHPEVCFLTVPAVCVDAGYALHVPAEELRGIGADAESLLCLAILTLRKDGRTTANMRAPVVIHRQRRQARQVIQMESDYSFEHPLGNGHGAEEAC